LLSAIVVIESRGQSGVAREALGDTIQHTPPRVGLRDGVGWKLDNDAQRFDNAFPIHLSQVWRARTDSAAGGSQSPWGTLVSSRLICQASRSRGMPATKRASQGCATIKCPHRRQRLPVVAARSASNFGVKGNRPRLIRGPSNASTVGTRVLVSNTLIPATRNPAIPMERISLIGTVKRARIRCYR